MSALVGVEVEIPCGHVVVLRDELTAEGFPTFDLDGDRIGTASDLALGLLIGGCPCADDCVDNVMWVLGLCD